MRACSCCLMLTGTSRGDAKEKFLELIILSDFLLFILNTIVNVNDSNKVLKTEMLFSDFFLSR